MNIDIVPIPPASSIADPLDPLYEAYTVVDRANEIELTGNDDLASDPRSIQNGTVDQTYCRYQFWVAFPSGQRDPSSTVGTASLQFPTNANTHLAEAVIVVHPGYRSQGIGKQLLEPLKQSILQSGRSTVATWTETRPYQEADGLVPKTGVGQIEPNAPASHWLQELGFELEQTGRRNMLEIPDDQSWWDVLDQQFAHNLEKAGPDYELVQWRDDVPVELRGQMALMRTRMSTDEPTAGMDYEEDPWDAERIVAADRKREQRGFTSVTTAARHVPSGQVVAYTELWWMPKTPAPVDQADTFVLAEHRGHRLGAILKAANLKTLLEVNPEAKRIYTWNAGENRYMLAINDELGFKVVTVEGSWQKRLSENRSERS